MNNDPAGKSLEQLEKDKLQAEIDILHARLLKEFPEEKTPGWTDKLAGFAQKWSAFILGTVTLISAVFGIFVPVSEYLAEQRRALQYDLNENMIGFVNDLTNDSLANRAVVMLSYYEVNSIPILLFYLETTTFYQNDFRTKLIETISMIYADTRNDEILDLIIVKMDNTFQRIQDDFLNSEGQEINGARRQAMLNYIHLINGMKLSHSDQKKVLRLYGNMRDVLCSTTVETANASIVFKDKALAIFQNICIYMGVDYDCSS
ncbi:MAG: hypothetical protein P8100_11840 [bacterium]|jgi:hypothetical protein